MTRLMLTASETADALGISDDLVYRLCRDGEIPHRRFGRRVLIPRVVVNELCGLVVATPDSLRGPAAADGESGIGATGPLDTGTCGEVGSTVGPSASGRPVAPPTTKARSGASDRATTTPA